MDDDELYDDFLLFKRRTSTGQKSPVCGGRLALSRKLPESRPAIKINGENTLETKAKCFLSENKSTKRSNSYSLQSDSENGKRSCLLSAVDEPRISSFSPSAVEQADQKASSIPNDSHLELESSDQFKTLECQQNISDDMFLSLDSNNGVCDTSNKSVTTLCAKTSEDTLLPHCKVNVKTLNEVSRLDDSRDDSFEIVNEDIWNKLPIEKSQTLPNCGKSKLEMHQPTTFLTGGANSTKEASATAKKSANKKAWEGMMSMMRSSDTSKKPVVPFSTSVKMAAQTRQSKPSGGKNANTATTTTTSYGSRWKSNGNRPCPFYKKIPGTNFVVDAFNYGTIPGATSYFLSHFHSDHYIGLKASCDLPIYCTSITASLVQSNIRVKSQYLHILPLHQAQEIEGVQVTALDANHCPGSAMLLFQLRNGTNILHVGDFRATPAMEQLHELSGLRISQLYLDTTYCNAKYDFPTQEDAVASAIALVLSHLHKHPRTVIVCGTYLIGKEKLFMGVAETLDCRIWTLPPKAKILRQLQDPALTARLIDDPLGATVHVVSMRQLNLESLQKYAAQYSKQFSHVLALKPSGWEHSRRATPLTRGNVTIAGVAYSEHSSFSELARFVKFFRPSAIIPTVNVGSAQSRQAMQKHFNTWLPFLR